MTRKEAAARARIALAAKRTAEKQARLSRPAPAPRIQEKPAPSTPSGLLPFHLTMRHSINGGKFLGPGVVYLTKAKGEALLNTEFMASEKEESLTQQRAYIIGMGPGGPAKRQVPWEQFDTIIGGGSR